MPRRGVPRRALGPIATVIGTVALGGAAVGLAPGRIAAAAGTAELSVQTSVAPASVVAGQAATQTVTVTDAGPSDATATTITVPIPNGTSVTSAGSPAGSCTVAATQVTCSLGDVSPGTPVNATVVYAVSAAATGTLAYSASVTATTTDTDSSDDQAGGSVPIAQSADVSISGSVTNNPVVAGTTTAFTFSIHNAGPSDATNVRLDGTLPSGITITGLGGDPGVTCDASGCFIPTLRAGTTLTGSLTALVAASLADGTVLAVNVQPHADTPDPNPANNNATAATTVTTVGRLDVTQTGNPAAAVVPGAPYTYQVTVKNNGPSDARSVSLIDTLPSGMTAQSATADRGSCAVSADHATISCAPGTVAAGTSVHATFTVLLAASAAPATITNTVTASSTTPATAGGARPQQASNSLTKPVQPTSDLAVTKTADPTGVNAGDRITWTITVHNAGPSAAANVVITDPLSGDPDYVPGIPPADMPVLGAVTATSSQGSCALSASPDRFTIATCNIGTIPVGVDVTMTVSARVSPAYAKPVVIGQATVTSASQLPSGGTSNVSTVTVGAVADLGVQVTPGSDPVAPGTALSYTVTITDHGPSDADGVAVDLPVPAGVIAASVSGPGGPLACPNSAGTLHCTLGHLAADATAVLTVTGTADPAATGTLTEAATVSATSADLDPGNDTDSADVSLHPRADVSLTMTANPEAPGAGTTAVPGDQVSYTFTVHNAGPSDAHDLALDAALPTGLLQVSAGGPGWTCTGSDCELPSLAAGVDATVTVVATVDPSATGTVSTSASVTAATDDPDTADNTASETLTLQPYADLAITADLAPDPPIAGSPASYTVSVTNRGPSDATGVVVTDPLPAGQVPGTPAPTDGRCTIAGQVLRCDIDRIAPDGTVTVTIPVVLAADVDPAGFSTTATVSSDAFDPDLADNAATVAGAAAARADLALTETASQPVTTGGTVRWTLTVRNDGPSAATAIELTDQLPTAAREVTVQADPAGVACTGSRPVRCTLARLAVGATATFTVTARVYATASAALVDAAMVDAAEVDPNPSDNLASARSRVLVPAGGSDTPDPAAVTPAGKAAPAGRAAPAGHAAPAGRGAPDAEAAPADAAAPATADHPADTGVPVTGLIGTAAVLVVAGLVVMIAARRRRPRHIGAHRR